MPHTVASWKAHPGRNPAHKFGEGRPRWQQKMPLPDGTETTVTMVGPKIVNRWLPHQGRREMARRVRTFARAELPIAAE